MKNPFFAVRFRPKLIEALKNYSRSDLRADLVAGITVGIVALPLAMAFGIASGVKPAAGIYTAIVAGFIISALGGSRVQIGGPTGAFVAIVYGIVVQYGFDNLIICTLMAGVILIVLGLLRLGTMIKYIPYPVTTGFTSGIAILILSTQIKDFFGLAVEKMPADFLPKLQLLATQFHPHWPATAFAAGSVALIFLWPAKLGRYVPGSFVAVFLGAAAVMLFHLDQSAGLETIGTRFGGIPQSLPSLHLPALNFSELPNLIRPAFTIALLAAIESLLCAVVADGMIDDRHDSNQELLAQGAANIGSALVGGIPATGAIARTATNIRNGGRTPMAGITHAATLLGIILAAAPLAQHIPLATLSAVLVVVAIRMGEWHQFARLRRWPRSDALVFLTAFLLTVLIDLTVAVEVGLVLAAGLFVKRISETTQIIAADERSEISDHLQPEARVTPGVMVYRVFGAFFFGAVDKLESALKRANQPHDVLVLRMDTVLAMDATGLNALEELHRRLQKQGRLLILCGAHTQPLLAMQRSGFVEAVGAENVCENLEAALIRARQWRESREAAN